MKTNLPTCDVKDCRNYLDGKCKSHDTFEQCTIHSMSAYDGAHKIMRVEAMEEFWKELQRIIIINNTEDGYLNMAIDYNCLIEDGNELLEKYENECKEIIL